MANKRKGPVVVMKPSIGGRIYKSILCLYTSCVSLVSILMWTLSSAEWAPLLIRYEIFLEPTTLFQWRI